VIWTNTYTQKDKENVPERKKQRQREIMCSIERKTERDNVV